MCETKMKKMKNKEESNGNNSRENGKKNSYEWNSNGKSFE